MSWDEHVDEKMETFESEAIDILHYKGYLEAELIGKTLAFGCLKDDDNSLELSKKLGLGFYHWCALLDDVPRFSEALYDDMQPEDGPDECYGY